MWEQQSARGVMVLLGLRALARQPRRGLCGAPPPLLLAGTRPRLQCLLQLAPGVRWLSRTTGLRPHPHPHHHPARRYHQHSPHRPWQVRNSQLLRAALLSGATCGTACFYSLLSKPCASSAARADGSAAEPLQPRRTLLDQVPADALAEMAKAFPEAQACDLARFLIACKHDVAKACERFRKTTAWRETELVELLQKNDMMPEYCTGKLIVQGVDKSNRPLLIWDNSIHRPKECDVEAGTALILAQVERILTTLPGDEHQMTILIYSPGGSEFDRKLIRRAAKIFTEHYPERLGRLMIMPTGNFAWWFWALVSPFLPRKTSGKVWLSDPSTLPPPLLPGRLSRPSLSVQDCRVLQSVLPAI